VKSAVDVCSSALYRLTIRIHSDDTICSNTNALFGPLFGAEATTKRIFGTSIIYTCTQLHCNRWSANYTFTITIACHNGNCYRFCCKAIQLQATLQMSQVLETVISISLTGSDPLNENW